MLPSLVRTYVPYFVGLIVSWLAMLGINVDDDTRGVLITALSFAVGTVYHLIVRLLEQRWPALSALLGSFKQPTYGEEDNNVPAAGDNNPQN